MKNISGMYVQQTRLFAPDVVPYRLVITALGSNRLRQAFGFGSTNWQENLEYVFQDGTIEYKGRTVPITWASFHDRRILIQVLGDSSAAHAVYSAIREVLSELDPDFRGAAPLEETEETSCAVQLAFDWTVLLNPALVECLSDRVQELSTEKAGRFIKGVNIRFTLGVEVKRKDLSERGITLFDQNVIIEPRADTPLSERIYYTYSPCDSDTHLRLVSELEERLSGQTGSDRSRGKASVRRQKAL
jgi:hypothetical protein